MATSEAGAERGARSRSLRVVHLMGTLRPSGMERMLVSAADGFREERVEGLVVGQGGGHTYETELRQAGYRVHIVPPVRSARGSVALYRLLRRARPDVVHVHTEGFFLPTVLLCVVATRSRRIVHTVHNVFSGSSGWRARRRIQTGVADRLLSEVLAPSPDVVENERGFARRTTLVWNWVDQRFFALAERRDAAVRRAGPQRYLLVGNCNDAKNHGVALAAVQRGDGVVAHLGDEGGADDEERRLLAELDRAGRLARRGSQPPDEALLEADAYLMPSRNEGMGVALAEAMTVGVPSLVADAPGLRWAAGMPGVTTVPLPQESWTRALRAFDAGERPASGEQPVDFSPRRGAREYADAYRRAVGRGGR